MSFMRFQMQKNLGGKPLKGKYKRGEWNQLKFWRKRLSQRPGRAVKVQQLRDYFSEMIDGKNSIHILDAGSGPYSTIGYTWPGVEVHLTLADILADDYAKIMRDLNIPVLIPVGKVDMSDMPYAGETFDIVHCGNALDHSENPRAAILEMVRVCKRGGWVYLRHIAHEAERLNYKGMHFWNIDATLTTNDCRVWNMEDQFLLSECMEGFTVDVAPVERREYITIKLEKK